MWYLAWYHCNCLVWAVLARLRLRGSRFTWRQSHSGWFPHFLVKAGGHTVSFKPLQPTPHKLPPMWFHGCMRWADPPVMVVRRWKVERG